MAQNRNPDPLAPETVNDEQEEVDSQAQTVTDEALDRTASPFRLSDSEKRDGGLADEDDTQDLVDHMNQMVTSGRIDMSAYRGEDNLDDQEDALGEAAKPDPDLNGES